MTTKKTQWMTEHDTKSPFNPLTEYDRIVGEQCRENKTWRRIAVCSFLGFITLTVITLLICVMRLSRPKTIPLVIEVAEWGEAKYVGDISKYSYNGVKVPEIAIQYQIRKFLVNLYTIPSDPDVLKKNLKDCYSAMTGSSADKLSKQIKTDNPFNNFGEINRSVEIESVLALSQNSYQADFILTTSRPDTSGMQQVRMRAVLTTRLMEPGKEDQIQNPLGIYITNWDVSQIEGGNK